jgi:twitching motility two-component system response regulator PilH
MSTILLVDDEMDFRSIFTFSFQHYGYKTLVAASGREALGIIYAYKPDLIILDDMLPDINGSQICQEIKADPAMRDIPVVMCSAGQHVLNPAYKITTGADAVLPKPVRPREIASLVEKLLSAPKDVRVK